jgi:7-cyano-7-deazaguanine synthase
MQKRAITLLSGGLDSATATLMAQEEYELILALTFDYGQRAAQREIQAASLFCRHYKIAHKIFSLPWLAELSPSALNVREIELPSYQVEELDCCRQKALKTAQSVWVPNRNGLFINIAACFAETLQCEKIITGFNEEEAETFPDNSRAFIAAMNGTLSYATLSQCQLYVPTAGMVKSQVAKKARQMGLQAEHLWSCYEGGEKMCGRCESCARMIRAFKEAGGWAEMRGRFYEAPFSK